MQSKTSYTVVVVVVLANKFLFFGMTLKFSILAAETTSGKRLMVDLILLLHSKHVAGSNDYAKLSRINLICFIRSYKASLGLLHNFEALMFHSAKKCQVVTNHDVIYSWS